MYIYMSCIIYIYIAWNRTLDYDQLYIHHMVYLYIFTYIYRIAPALHL